VRILFGVLVIANLAVFLLAARLPAPESGNVPKANIPRVEPIRTIEAKEGVAKPPQNP
jgi:hypothetical protein